MKMNIDEFIERQGEFEGHKIKVKTKWKDGSIRYFERLVNDKCCNSNGEFFEILEVEILEHIGITTIKVGDNGRFGLSKR